MSMAHAVNIDERHQRWKFLCENYDRVVEKKNQACQHSCRNPDEVRILPVSKYHTLEDMLGLYQHGVCRFAENIDHIGRTKFHEIAQKVSAGNECGNISLEMIGQIQRNKITSLIQWATRLHSVDRVSVVTRLERVLAEKISNGELASRQICVDVQCSLDGDPHRGGAYGEDVFVVAEKILQAQHLRLGGLMVILPLDSDPEDGFARAAGIREKFLRLFPDAQEFSAGMSSDLELAIEYGSTCVRVGTAIFGPRQLAS